MQHDVEKKFIELKKLVEEMGTDVEKYTAKKNRSAGLRIRKYMIDVKDLAVEIRKDILESRRNHL